MKINGRDIVGRNITIRNGVITVDGKIVDNAVGTVKIEVEGDLVSLDTDSDVVCGNVSGNVDAGGSVSCGMVSGNVDAGGSVSCGNVGSYVDAGGSVSCGNVSGNVDAGGSVRGIQ